MKLSLVRTVVLAAALAVSFALGGCTSRPNDPPTNGSPTATGKFDKPQKKRPKNGTVEYFVKQATVSEAISLQNAGDFTVSAPGGNRCYYMLLRKLKDAGGAADSGTRYLSMFVQPGTKVHTQVPFGRYRLYYASGSKWYGTTYLFGPATTYGKAEVVLRFYLDGTQRMGNTIDMVEQPGGNFPTSTARPDDFG